MATKTNPITPELEAKALSVVASLTGPPAGFVPATAGQVTVGQVVSCWGHNKQRVGVVTEVTKTRVHVLFTTPGAIKEAQDGTARTLAQPTDVESYIAGYRRTYTSNYLFLVNESRDETAEYGWHYNQGSKVRDQEYLVNNADRLAELEEEGFEARLARQSQAQLDGVLKNRLVPWQDRVGYTHSWKKISDCYVEEVVA
jgi:hypothetical protein